MLFYSARAQVRGPKFSLYHVFSNLSRGFRKKLLKNIFPKSIDIYNFICYNIDVPRESRKELMKMFKVYSNEEAVCPNKCGRDLEPARTVEISETWYGVKITYDGSCPVCRKKFRWDEFFTFLGTGKPESLEV